MADARLQPQEEWSWFDMKILTPTDLGILYLHKKSYDIFKYFLTQHELDNFLNPGITVEVQHDNGITPAQFYRVQGNHDRFRIGGIGWRHIVEENGFAVGDTIDLWIYRDEDDDELGLAVTRP
jgi:hypothetical protein